MDERSAINNDLVVSGLCGALPAQVHKVVTAMAFLLDPNTRDLTKRVDEIGGKSGAMLFPEQVAEVIQQLCHAGNVEKVSEGDTPIWRVAANYKRLVEDKEMIARGEQPFPYVAPGPTDFRQYGPRRR